MSKFGVIEVSLRRLAARHPAPIEELVLLRLIHHVSNEMNLLLRRLLKPSGLNEWEYRTLVMLQSGGRSGVPMAQLSHIAGETATNMTRICNQLVAGGWACRMTDAADRRKVMLTIMPKAEALLAKATPGIWEQLERGMNVFNPQEIAQLTKLLKRLAVRAESAAREPARLNSKPGTSSRKSQQEEKYSDKRNTRRR
jgi:MarR family transcriptional regulator, negative regulator of the multidrug operon emrRAB